MNASRSHSMCFARDKLNDILHVYILFRFSLDFHVYEQQHESVLVRPKYSENIKLKL